jgi:hypothetical protein
MPRQGSLAALVVLFASSAFADDLSRLAPLDVVDGDAFGLAVAASGGTVVVGAPGDDQDAGSAYVFVACRGFLPLQQKLLPADPQASTQFGASVAVSGDVAVVGSPGAGGGAGAVYVFERACGVWTQREKLGGLAGEQLGASVALDGDTIVAGAPARDAGRGAVRVFAHIAGAWTQQAVIAGEAPAGRFGRSVAIRGDRFVAGAPGADSFRGLAFVYVRSGTTWAQDARLSPADRAVDDEVGAAVAIGDDWVAVAAPYVETPGTTDAGAVHVYGRIAGTWARVTRLTAPTPANYSQFGVGLAIEGSTLVVGSPSFEGGPSQSGRVDVFAARGSGFEFVGSLESPTPALFDSFGTSVALSQGRVTAGSPFVGGGVAFAGWAAAEQKVLSSDPVTIDGFGISVAIDGETALVGVWQDDDKGVDSGAAFVFVRSGGVWCEQQKLTAVDGQAGDRFGWSVALSGDTALLGAERDDDGGADAGSAYVFVRTDGTWSQQEKFVPGDAAAGDELGWSVALDGDTALVGADRDDDPAAGADVGAVYVFVRTGSGWNQQQKLTAADGAPDDLFGQSVALSGDTALVGAASDDDKGGGSGSAYVFVRTSGAWSQQQKLTAGDGAAGDLFGWSVALRGDTALVGAPRDDDKGTDSGSAYVFVRSGAWSEAQKLTAQDGVADDEFGFSVALDGNVALVGAYGANGNGDDAGAAYVFVQAGGKWNEQEKFDAPDGAPDDRYGWAVALSGDTALIGAYRDDDVADLSGSAWFRRLELPSHVNSKKLAASDGETGEQFAWSLAVSGDTALVGARLDDDKGAEAGAAYVFVRTAGAWSQQQKLTAGDGAAGQWFGWSVALDGDTALVAAYRDNAGAGAVYAFQRTEGVWSERQKLTASDAEAGDAFGSALALSGDAAFATAPFDDDRGGDAGAAYFFERAGGVWSQRQKLTASDGADDDSLGLLAAATSGDTAVFGASSAGAGGAAYVFGRSGGVWAEQQKLTASDGEAGDSFGYPVAVSGDTLLVGGSNDDDNGSNAGSAYVFTRTGTTWSQRQKLTPSDGAAGDVFGASLAFLGDTAVITSQLDNSGAGSAYVFVRTGATWAEQSKLTAPDGAATDYFGLSVALSDTTVLVGAVRADNVAVNSGAVYVFDEPRTRLAATIPSLPSETTIGVPLSATATVANGTPPYQWRVVEGFLPDDVRIDVGAGTLSGPSHETGSFAWTIEVCDASGETVSGDGAITVNPAPAIPGLALHPAVVGRPYLRTLPRTGGTGALTWSLDDGGSGLTVSANGTIGGTPDSAGAFEIVVGCTDSVGATAADATATLRVLDLLAVPKGRTVVGVAPGGGPTERAMELLGGSTLTVVAKAAKGFAAPALSLFDASGAQLDLGAALWSKSGVARLTRYAVPATGRYVLRVTPGAANPLAVITLTVTVAPARSVKAARTLDAGTQDFVVPALAGSKVTVTIAAAKGQTVEPTVVSVKNDAGDDVAGTTKVSAKRVIVTIPSAPGGDLHFGIAAKNGTAGGATVVAVVKPPKGYLFDIPESAGGE